MLNPRFGLRIQFASIAAALVMVVLGCQQGELKRDDCETIPWGAVPAPTGTYHNQWKDAQVSRADRDYLVFYQYEWLGDSGELSPFGKRHLQRLIPRLVHATSPIVVETSGDDQRDRVRAATLRAELGKQESAWVDYPVIIGTSEAEPLYGFESNRVINGLNRGNNGSQGGNSGGNSGGGFGGGAGGSGGGFGGGGIF